MTLFNRLRGYNHTADWITGYFNLGLDVKLTLGLIAIDWQTDSLGPEP